MRDTQNLPLIQLRNLEIFSDQFAYSARGQGLAFTGACARAGNELSW